MSQISAEIYGTLEVSVEGSSSTITVAIGTPGPAASVTVGTTTTLSPGASATVANVGSTAAAVLNFGIPAGEVGATGPQGIQGPVGTAATITAGTTTTGAAGSSASVTNVGTSSAAVFDFTIPRGDKGETGNTGATGATGPAGTAATISVGTVTTGLPGTSAIVTNVGTSSAAVFEITIPRGDKGDTGNTGATGATGATGSGVAAGGTSGQALVKASNSSYDTTWTTIQTGDKYLTTSTTSLTIGNGSKSLTVATGLAYTTQQDIVIAYDASNHMHAVVTSYNSGTGALVADVQNHTGSGTYAVWTVNVGGTTTAVLPIGGTTGQILQKASATNYDVSWVTPYAGADALKTANNLSELTATATTARTNLGLGTMATQTAANYALLASPTFTGTPAAPTATAGTNTTQLATTAFVTTAASTKANIASPTFTGTVTIPAGASISGYLTTSTASATYAPLASPTFTGTVTIPAGASISGFAPLASPTFTGTPAAPTAISSTNTTQIATTAFVKAQGYATLASPTFTGTVTIPAGASISGYAPLASPTFTGTVTIPAGASISGYLTTSSASSTYAPLASPTFTGTVTIPAGASISGYLTTSTAASTYQTLSGMSSYLTTSSAASTYQTQSGMSSYLTTSAAASTYYLQTNPAGYQTASDVSTYVTGLGYQTATDVSTYVTGLGYLTDAPSDGSEYARKNGAWSVVTGGGGGVAWGAITGTVTDQTDLTTYISGLGYQTATDVSTYVTGLGYLTDAPSDGSIYGRKDGAWEVVAGGTTAADQLTAGVVATNPAAGPTASGDVLQYDGTDLIWAPGGGGGAVAWGSITGTVTDQTDLTTYISGLGYIGEAPIDGNPYVRKDGAWDINTAPVGSVAWGAITGTVTDQTDLTTYISGLGYQTSTDVSTYVGGLGYVAGTAASQLTAATYTTNPAAAPATAGEVLTFDGSGLTWSAPASASSVNTLTGSYTLVAGDAGNIVYCPPFVGGGFPFAITIPDDGTYSFAVGTIITVSVNNSSSGTDIYLTPGGFGVPTIVGPSGGLLCPNSVSGNFRLIKVAADLWVCS